MCGRYSQGLGAQDLSAALKVHFPSGWEPAFSLAITNQAPVMRERLVEGGELERQGGLLRWGVPDPAPERKGRPMQNARLSSLHYFDVWKELFGSGQRLVAPMQGWFEWIEPRPKYKQPIFIHDPTAPLLLAAGLWAGDGTFTIITVKGKDAAGEVHDRMPMLVDGALLGDWLNPEQLPARDGAALLKEVRAGSDRIAARLSTYPVTRELNNVRTVKRDDPSLLEPVELETV